MHDILLSIFYNVATSYLYPLYNNKARCVITAKGGDWQILMMKIMNNKSLLT